VVAGAAVGALAGLLNGLLITWLRLAPFIATLGMMGVARGLTFGEPKMRNLRQFSSDVLYRFFDDKFYAGARYITLNGQMLLKNYSDQNVNRWQVGGGWFVTPNVLSKVEWVNEQYNNFPTTNIYNGGQFKGFMISGVVGF